MAKDRDATLTELRQKYPDWYIWYTAKARGGTVWSAGRPSNMIATFEAKSADELDGDLTEVSNGSGKR